MERRAGLRGRTDLSVRTKIGCLERRVRGVEISGTGIVLDQRRDTPPQENPLFVHLTIGLPERRRLIIAVARPVWSYGCHQAFRFVEISDVDRLTLAEHLDVLQHRGTRLH